MDKMQFEIVSENKNKEKRKVNCNYMVNNIYTMYLPYISDFGAKKL